MDFILHSLHIEKGNLKERAPYYRCLLCDARIEVLCRTCRDVRGYGCWQVPLFVEVRADNIPLCVLFMWANSALYCVFSFKVQPDQMNSSLQAYVYLH